MKKIIMVVFTVVTFATLANAGIIQSTTDLTEAEFDNLVSDSVIAARLVFRAGGANSWELEADNNDGVVNVGVERNSESWMPVSWSFNSGNAINVVWDGNLDGNISLAVTPSGGGTSEVTTSPLTWFNTILVSAEQHTGFISSFTLSNNDVSGESFNDLTAPVVNSWDGIRINLSGYDAANQAGLTLSSILTPNGLGAADDQFRGEIYFLQVPEPATMSLIGLAGLTIWVIRRSRLRGY